ncbi:MAG: hypothetical protein MJ126_01760 [Lachnospiraceae bacterium]|nr:hypothetical protein [Lachnospiraceae bacterium]
MRNKKLIASVLTVLLSFSLVGCDFNGVNLGGEKPGMEQIEVSIADPVKDAEAEGEKPEVKAEDTDEKENENNNQIETNNETTDYAGREEEIFTPVIDEVIEYIASEEIDYKDGYTGIEEVRMYSDVEETYEMISYAMLDLNEDGVKELLIGLPSETEEGYRANLLQVYTIIDGKAVIVLEGWGRNRHYLLNDGRIYSEGSSGAAYSSMSLCTLGADGDFIIDEYYFTDFDVDDPSELVVYKSLDGSVEVKTAEKADITVDDLWLLMDYYLGEIDQTPFWPLSRLTSDILAEEVASENMVMVDYVLVDDSTDEEYATYVQLYANKAIKDLKVMKISDIDFDDKGMTFKSNVIKEIDSVDQFAAVLLKINSMGDMPEYAISYTNDKNEEMVYTIGFSGMDGSVFLSKVE